MILDNSQAIPQNERTPSLENFLQQLTQTTRTTIDTEWSENYTDFNPQGWSTKPQHGSTVSETNFDDNSGAEKIEVLVATPASQ